MRPTGLQKTTLDVSFKAGLIEKIAPEMAPPEGMYRLENVELDKVGAYKRRRGFSFMTSAVLGPSAFGTFGVPKKVAGRAGELFVISEDPGYLGSGGGSGVSGSVVWSYSPQSNAWRAHSKVPSCTAEREASIINGQTVPKWFNSAFCYKTSTNDHKYLVLSYQQNSWAGSNIGIRAMVWDTESQTEILEDRVVATTTIENKVQSITVGSRYALIIYREISVSAVDMKVVVYDAETPNQGFSAPMTLLSGSQHGGRGWAIGTDGSDVYLLTIASGTTGGAYADHAAYCFRYGITWSAAVQTGSLALDLADDCNPGITVAGGRVHASFKQQTTLDPFYRNFSTTLANAGNGIAMDATSVEGGGHVLVAAINADEACVFWQEAAVGSVAGMGWRWVKLGTTVSIATRTATHRQWGLAPRSHPFTLNSRVYIAVTGVSAPASDGTYAGGAGIGGNLGHVLVEVNSSGTVEDSAGGAYGQMMPVALWSRDISLDAPAAVPSFAVDGDVYITSIRESRKSDALFIDAPTAPGVRVPTPHTVAVWAFDAMHVRFNDLKRWQHAEIDDLTVVASALPYAYDGERAHECGYVFRPVIQTAVKVNAGTGGFPANTVVTYKTVYEWEDFVGRRWFSDTSYPAQVSMDASSGDVTLTIRPPWLTVKPEGSFDFTARVKVNVYRSTQDAPEEFELLSTTTHMIWGGGGAYDNALITLTDAGVNLSTTERAYIFGGELDNYVAPSCRSLIQHRDRLFAINLEDNSLWYTKPFNRGRGIEWSRFQTKALPQKGVALASIEGSLLVFTNKSILVLEGPGPSSTGIPPDAFSRFSVLSQDQGCSEVNAAWRTPRGVVFRSHQGLWLVTPQLAIIYIGAAVQDAMQNVTYFIDGQLDERLGCLRLLARVSIVASAEIFRTFVYWYDTDRWSIDTCDDTIAGTQYSTLFLSGQYYAATALGVRKRSDSRFLDGNESSSTAVYQAVVQTGWYRFDSMASFKRLWRVLPSFRLPAPSNSQHLNVTVETNQNSSTFGFLPATYDSALTAFDGSLRLHVKYQKGQRYRITLAESLTHNTAAGDPPFGPAGYTFTGIGFELGMKRGAAKLGAEKTL